MGPEKPTENEIPEPAVTSRNRASLAGGGGGEGGGGGDEESGVGGRIAFATTASAATAGYCHCGYR